MRTSLALCVALLSFAGGNAQDSSGKDSTGLPGDNFSLQGALEMFKKAASPEEFEKLINTQDNNVNNLDLNGDGDIDYIRVIDKRDKDLHAFVLQVAVSEKESQDIAVIELEKTADAAATLQILGDEDIYGEQTIVEPDGGGEDDDDVDDNNGGGGGGPRYSHMARVVVNVWGWPGVRFVYAPAYVAWVSPWTWHRHPLWWRPWRPVAWRVFHPFRLRPGFAVVRTHRVVRAHRIYTPGRVTSVTVRTRHGASINRYRVNTRHTIIKTRPGNVRGKAKATPRGGKRRN